MRDFHGWLLWAILNPQYPHAGGLMMWMSGLCLCVALFLQETGTEMVPRPLDGAVWRGELSIHMQADLLQHYLENKSRGTSGIQGFLQKKSTMDGTLDLKIVFYLNSLGETSLIATRQLNAQLREVAKDKYSFVQEMLQEGGITGPVEVVVHENKDESVVFAEEIGPTDALGAGYLTVTPEGQLSKRSSLRIEGSWPVEVTGSGSYELTKRRYPPSEEYGQLKETAKVKRRLPMEVTWTQTVSLKKEPVRSGVNVNITLDNPFFQEGQSESGVTYVPKIQTKGELVLIPLFGKKANQRP
jgi:hypothetical protein